MQVKYFFFNKRMLTLLQLLHFNSSGINDFYIKPTVIYYYNVLGGLHLQKEKGYETKHCSKTTTDRLQTEMFEA